MSKNRGRKKHYSNSLQRIEDQGMASINGQFFVKKFFSRNPGEITLVGYDGQHYDLSKEQAKQLIENNRLLSTDPPGLVSEINNSNSSIRPEENEVPRLDGDTKGNQLAVPKKQQDTSSGNWVFDLLGIPGKYIPLSKEPIYKTIKQQGKKNKRKIGEKKTIEDIKIIDLDNAEVFYNSGQSFRNPIKNMKYWLINNANDSDRWIRFLEEKKAEFKPNANEIKIDSIKPIFIDHTKKEDKSESNKPLIVERIELAEKKNEEESKSKELVPQDIINKASTNIIIKPDLMGINTCECGGMITSQDIYVLIADRSSGEPINYHCFKGSKCNSCGNAYIDQTPFEIVKKKLKGGCWFRATIRYGGSKLKSFQTKKNLIGNAPKGESTEIDYSKLNLIPTKKNILVIRKSLMRCLAERHRLDSAQFDIPIRTKQSELSFVRVEIQYCHNCRRYSIYEDVFLNAVKPLGSYNVLKRFTYNGKSWGLINNATAVESPLKQAGYCVNQKENLSKEVRRSILSYLISARVLEREEIKVYLRYFINTIGGMPSNYYARRKWQDDYDWLCHHFEPPYHGHWTGKTKW